MEMANEMEMEVEVEVVANKVEAEAVANEEMRIWMELSPKDDLKSEKFVNLPNQPAMNKTARSIHGTRGLHNGY